MSEKLQKDQAIQKIFKAKNSDEIMALMVEEAQNAEREKILKEMNPACRKKFKSIETWLRKEVTHMLRSRYELGLQVQDLYEDNRNNNGNIYGKNAIGRICRLLKWDDGVIRLSLRFVRMYSKEDMERLCDQILPTGRPLTWSHVRVLLEVDNAKQRQELLDKTISEGWSCNELAREFKKLDDGGHSDGRGRPPKVPTNFDGALAQQQQAAEGWDRLYGRVWGVKDRSLDAQAAKLPTEEVTEERLWQARQLARQLRKVATQATQQAETAEQVVRDFEEMLKDWQHSQGIQAEREGMS